MQTSVLLLQVRRLRGDGSCFYRAVTFQLVFQAISTSTQGILLAALQQAQKDITFADAEIVNDFAEPLYALLTKQPATTPDEVVQAFNDYEISNSAVVVRLLLSSIAVKPLITRCCPSSSAWSPRHLSASRKTITCRSSFPTKTTCASWTPRQVCRPWRTFAPTTSRRVIVRPIIWPSRRYLKPSTLASRWRSWISLSLQQAVKVTCRLMSCQRTLSSWRGPRSPLVVQSYFSDLATMIFCCRDLSCASCRKHQLNVVCKETQM